MATRLRLLSSHFLRQSPTFTPTQTKFASTMGAGPSTAGPVKASVDKAIAEHVITIFSKTYCPYCSKTKKTIADADVEDVKIIELDNLKEGAEMQDYLQSISGQRTVPQIWINQQFIGGNSDLQALSSSQLQQKIKA